MIEAFLKITPIIAIFALGYGLKKLKVFKLEDGEVLLKLLFYVVSPALIYVSMSDLFITPHLLVFPILACVNVFTMYLINILVTKSFALSRKTLGSYLVGTMVANTGIALPFVLSAYGTDGVARIAMWDFVGGILTYTFIYSIAVKYGDQKPNSKFIIQKILVSPPVWALLLGLTANLANFQTPEIIVTFLKSLGGLFSPLFMLALGFFFAPKTTNPKLLSFGILIRMLGGFIIGYTLAYFFGLTGMDRAIAIICCSAPAGFVSLTFAKLENLDSEFAASLVSTSLMIALVVIPVLTVVLK